MSQYILIHPFFFLLHTNKLSLPSFFTFVPTRATMFMVVGRREIGFAGRARGYDYEYHHACRGADPTVGWGLGLEPPYPYRSSGIPGAP